jgi:hypothetical protein
MAKAMGTFRDSVAPSWVTALYKVCHSYVTALYKVCHSYVTALYKVCHSYVTALYKVCHSYVTLCQSIVPCVCRASKRNLTRRNKTALGPWDRLRHISKWKIRGPIKTLVSFVNKIQLFRYLDIRPNRNEKSMKIPKR